MKGMVLAAGLGTRLRPFTDIVPKPLFPILGVPVVGWALRSLACVGVSRIVMNLHHLPDSIVRILGIGRDFGVQLDYANEPEILGTGGGLSAVRTFFAGDRAFLVHNGDVFTDWDLSLAIEEHLQSGADATMLLADPPDMPAARLVEIDSEGRVVGVRGRPASGDGVRYVFSGISILSQAIFDFLPVVGPSCLIENGILPMLGAGLKVRGRVMPGRFCDVGTPQRFVDLNRDLMPEAQTLFQARGLLSLARLAPGILARGRTTKAVLAALEAPVLLGHDVAIEPGSHVGPNVVLCDKARVVAGARVRDAVVFPGSVVEGTREGIVL